jgi:hypothetical protein
MPGTSTHEGQGVCHGTEALGSGSVNVTEPSRLFGSGACAVTSKRAGREECRTGREPVPVD